MSDVQLVYLPDHVPVYRCANCSIELALQDELVSRAFSGAHGPAYLLRSVRVIAGFVLPLASLLTELSLSSINTKVGRKGAKELLTGKHIIARG